MFTHDDIWIAIDRLANSTGYSTSGLAKKAGLDPTAFNRSKRMSPEGKPRWPSTESLSKILAVTNITMNEFILFIREETVDLSSANAKKQRKSIPVIGYTQAKKNGFFNDKGYPQGEHWDRVNLPGMAPMDDSIYALEMSGNAMAPLYRDGDIIVVSPEAGIRRGDRVVIKTIGGDVMVRELARQTTSKIELTAFNPSYADITIAPKDIDWMVRILWVSQ